MTGDENSESISWSVRPYEKAPAKRYVIFAIALVAMAFGVFIYGQPLLGIVGFAIILGSTVDFWVGSSYKVDASGATSRTGLSVSNIRWEDVKRVVVGTEEVKVSPLEDGGSRMDAFRGVVLKLNTDNRAQVVDAIRRFGGENVRFLER